MDDKNYTDNLFPAEKTLVTDISKHHFVSQETSRLEIRETAIKCGDNFKKIIYLIFYFPVKCNISIGPNQRKKKLRIET